MKKILFYLCCVHFRSELFLFRLCTKSFLLGQLDIFALPIFVPRFLCCVHLGSVSPMTDFYSPLPVPSLRACRVLVRVSGIQRPMIFPSMPSSRVRVGGCA
jgi:hypothetical protein